MAKTPRVPVEFDEPMLSGEPDAAALDAPAPYVIVLADGVAHLPSGETVGYDEPCDLMVGRDLKQTGFEGLERLAGGVCVGPAHPAYVAINVAYQRGVEAVQIDGLSADEAAHLSPWIAAISHEIAVQLI